MLSYNKITEYIFIFLIAQLAMWYGGLANLIPDSLLAYWNFLQLTSIVLELFMFIVRRKRLNGFTIVFLFTRGILSISTWFNGNLVQWYTLSRMVSLVLLVNLYSEDLYKIVSPIMLIFEIMVYYNLITVLQNGADIYGAFYGALGYDNDFTRYLIVAYFFALMYLHLKKSYIRPMLLIIGIHITFIITWSATGLFATTIADVLLIISRISNFKINVLKGYFVLLIIEVGIVFLRVQNLFSFLIINILHKDLSFTGRTDIWDRSMSLILKKPILGWGSMEQVFETALLGQTHSHNAILEQLFRGGIIYYLLFLILIVLIHNHTTHFMRRRLVKDATIILFVIWIICVTESILEDYIIYLLLAVLYNVNNIKEKDKIKLKQGIH